MTDATAIRVRRRVLGERSLGVFIVSNGAFRPRMQEEAQCLPKGLSMVMELTMRCMTCWWGNEIEAGASPRLLTESRCMFIKRGKMHNCLLILVADRVLPPFKIMQAAALTLAL